MTRPGFVRISDAKVLGVDITSRLHGTSLERDVVVAIGFAEPATDPVLEYLRGEQAILHLWNTGTPVPDAEAIAGSVGALGEDLPEHVDLVLVRIPESSEQLALHQLRERVANTYRDAHLVLVLR